MLLVGGLPDGVHQGTLSRRVHGSPADKEERRHQGNNQPARGVQDDGHRGPGTGRERVARRLRRQLQEPDQIRTEGHQGRGRGRRRSHRCRKGKQRAVQGSVRLRGEGATGYRQEERHGMHGPEWCLRHFLVTDIQGADSGVEQQGRGVPRCPHALRQPVPADAHGVAILPVRDGGYRTDHACHTQDGAMDHTGEAEQGARTGGRIPVGTSVGRLLRHPTQRMQPACRPTGCTAKGYIRQGGRAGRHSDRNKEEGHIPERTALWDSLHRGLQRHWGGGPVRRGLDQMGRIHGAGVLDTDNGQHTATTLPA